MSHPGDNHLLCVAGEHCRGKLDVKEKAAFSFKYLLVYAFRVKSILMLFTQVCNPPVFHAACKLWMKNV